MGSPEQQRDTGGRRGWWLVGLLAVIGAAGGAFAGYRIDPDVAGLIPALAVAGLGLGGLLGLILLAPVGLWRAWRRRAVTSAPAEVPDAELPADEVEPEPPEPEEVEEPVEESPDRPPPPGGEPGWYPDPARDGVRQYWDGQVWTGHVWRGRERERTRKARNRSSS